MTEQELIQENSKLNNRLQNAIRIFAEQKNEIKKLNEDYSKLETSVAELKDQLIDKDNTIKDLNIQINELSKSTITELDDAPDEITKLKQEINNLQEKSLVDQLTISSLKKDAEVNDTKFKQLTDQISKANTKIEEQNSVINELNLVVSENNEQLDKITAERDQLNISNESIYSEYADKIRSLENELCEANEELTELKNQPIIDVSDYESRLEKAKQVFTESKEKIANLSETVTNLVNEKEHLIEQIAQKDNEIKNIKAVVKENEPIIKEINTYKIQMEKLAESAKNKDEETKKSIKLLEESENKRKDEAKKYEAEITKQGMFINKLIEQITGPFANAMKTINNVNDEIQHLYGGFKKS